MRIVLLGPPGAGKGTQAKAMAGELKLAHISTGDLLRQNVAQATKLGLEAKDYMNKGLLVPDSLVTMMLEDRFGQADVKNGFILDGYPRTLNQAKTLDAILARRAMKIDVVFDLDSSEAVIVQRLSGRLVCRKCGALFHRTNMPPKREGVCDQCGGQLYQRDDDKEATIKKRLAVYRSEVAALLEYYRTAGILTTISADDDAAVVLKKIIQKARSIK
ncbi:MAG TPA: adenylate kinase [Candidatus Omnitrophota bacterium]|nr:adenylate kinase [Candidatus Omnitrophota bacterium]